MPERKITGISWIMDMGGRPRECFEEALRRRVNIMGEFNSEMGNGARGIVCVAEGSQEPDQAT